jgi:hypothetical protein
MKQKQLLLRLTYKCPCGHTWFTWWNKYSKDECVKCHRHIDPEEKIQ